jgi:hypothetical protein
MSNWGAEVINDTNGGKFELVFLLTEPVYLFGTDTAMLRNFSPPVWSPWR